jgi:hypothetical protein
VPSFFPVKLPFETQHELLCHLQRSLEHARYDFGMRTMPETLYNRQWDCAESVELNRWTEEFLKRDDLFANVESSGKPISSILRSVANIRHTAVHRLRVSAKAIEQFLFDAEALGSLLGNEDLAASIGKLRRETKAAIEELERNKNFLRSRLHEKLQSIADQRAQLQLEEELAITEMIREDKEYQMLAGKTLGEIIAPSDRSFLTAIDVRKLDDTKDTDCSDVD